MKYVIPISAIFLFFSSCSNNSKSDLAVFRATTKSLEQSSKTISDITTNYRKQLFERLNDLRTAEQTAVWHPKAKRISELASSTIEYINKLKSQLVGKDGDFQVVNKIFFQQNKGEELHRQLRNFGGSIYTVDSSLIDRYADLTSDKFDYLDSVKYNDKEFTETFFSHVSNAAALSLLAKFENDILNMENKLITLCYYHTDSFSCGMDYFYPLINVNSVCVKSGDNIEISAGIGSFSVSAQPKAIIDDKIISVDENGVIAYKFKTPLKAGKYNKPVKIQYTKPDGTTESITKNIEYTVIEEQ
jgi:GldM N-terminal domain